ncbi:MAG: transcription elongation factor GreA [Defluviitaleaceae bacterium]|nr:transcription elongation factor GreA [Defluviitaleaceae bacterium]
MDEKKILLTTEGFKNLENELSNLKIVRRKDVAEKIKEARGQGDLSENAEYDAAKEEQAEIEARIVTIEKMLRNAEIIAEEEISSEVVSLGSTVKVLDIEFNEEKTYTIVGPAEANPKNGFISYESPLGVALINRKANETVEINAVDGIIEYKILELALKPSKN